MASDQLVVAPMVTRRVPLPDSSVADFGEMLRVLRHRPRLTQRELGLAVGYSEAQISRLEKGKRLPDPSVVAALFLPSLGLANEPELAARLHRLAEAARASSDQEPTPAGPGHRCDGDVPAAIADDLADIPAAPQPNVHRAAGAAELARRLAAQRRVLITGPPGMGKTCLAADAARRHAGRSGICWLTLTAGITTPVEAVVRRLARFLARHGETEVMPLLDLGKTEHPLPRDEQLHALGIIQKNRGATERALELFEESRALKQRIGDLDGAANSEHGRARAAVPRAGSGGARHYIGGARGFRRSR